MRGGLGEVGRVVCINRVGREGQFSFSLSGLVSLPLPCFTVAATVSGGGECEQSERTSSPCSWSQGGASGLLPPGVMLAVLWSSPLTRLRESPSISSLLTVFIINCIEFCPVLFLHLLRWLSFCLYSIDMINYMLIVDPVFRFQDKLYLLGRDVLSGSVC